MNHQTPTIALTEEITRMARKGAWFVNSVSGGKDSLAAMSAVNEWLDSVGHPHERRIALHADLGRAEWPDTLDTIRHQCDALNLPLKTVSQPNDLVWRFEDRWRRCLERYAKLETINIPPPWSSSSSLFCRSEYKAAGLSRFKAKLDNTHPVVGIIGIRRDESPKRSQTPIVSKDTHMMTRHGREGLLWNPIVEWTVADVYDHVEKRHLPMHRAYGLGSSRLSCRLCVLQSGGDMTVSIASGPDDEVIRRYAMLEILSAFPFQQNRWLNDMIPSDLVDQSALSQAKAKSTVRRFQQLRIPENVLRQKTIKHITYDEAMVLADVRCRVSEIHEITSIGTTASEIMALATL